MVKIGRYKQYPGSISRRKHRYPTYKGGKVTEVVVYANYTGLRRFYRYVVNIGRWSPYEGGQLDRFHCISLTKVHFVGLYYTVLQCTMQNTNKSPLGV